MLKTTRNDKGILRKATALVVCAVLLVCCAVGTTFAYLWDKSDTYINTFTAEVSPNPLTEANFIVQGKKTLSGRDWQEGDSFHFTLEKYDSSANVLEGDTAWKPVSEHAAEAVVYKPSDPSFDEETFYAFDFEEAIADIEFERAGSHLFRIVEKQGNLPGILYVDKPLEFSVHVETTSDGTALEITGITLHDDTAEGIPLEKNTDTGLFEIPAHFINTYSETPSTQAHINVQKTIEDKSVKENTSSQQSLSGFVFELYEAHENSFVVDTDTTPIHTARTNAAGEAYLANLSFDVSNIGSYYYVVREYIPTTDTTDDDGVPIAGMTYDTKARYLKVDVVEKSGLLTTEVTEYVSVETPDGALSFECLDTEEEISNTYTLNFTNTYDPTDASLTLQGTKTLQGRILNADEFSFNLYESAAGFSDTTEDKAILQTTSNDAHGTFIFDELTFAQTGIYYFEVAEDRSSPLDNITYDTTRYGVVVVVSDTQDGTLTTEVSYTHIGTHTTAENITFQNTYTEPGTDPEDPNKPQDPTIPTDPQGPSSPGTGDAPGSGSDTIADTGDDMGGIILLLVAALTASGAVILLVVARRLRK